ncbi:MAG TPA: PsbP-related protein [Nitrososphaeraceae archaeon]|nr:PsbP-related protein [Nitrososphaeraceae archaeon]
MTVKCNATRLHELNRDFYQPLVISMVISIILCVSIRYSESEFAFGSQYDNLLIYTSVSESEFLTYDDLITGFSIKYPPDWERAQHIDKSITFIAPKESNSDTFPAGLGIIFKEVASNMSLSYISQTQLNTLKNLYPNINILESSDITFAGHPAHKIIFTATDNTSHLRKAMQIWFKDDTKAYLITYKADVEKFPQYLPTIEKMLNTFYTSK